MYIPGPLPSPQLLEGFVVLSTTDFFRHTIATMKTIAANAESKGGRIRPESMPALGRIVTPIHGLAFFVPPAVYIGTLVLNRFQQPVWMTRFSLSNEFVGIELDSGWRNILRVAACIASFAVGRVTDSAFAHLAEQWHSLGRRERSRVVQTGPYAWVRHPMYTTVLLHEACWSIAFWSYVPLFALAITATAFAIKMPIEESSILKDEGSREEYRTYMEKVPARIIPFIW